MEAIIRCFDGKKELPSIKFELESVQTNVSDTTFATVVRVQTNHRRQGTACTKTRGELAFSNRKPFRQKGTGSARAGSLRSPLWRKGGVIFGPRGVCRRLSVNKKNRKALTGHLIADAMLGDKFLCLDFSQDLSLGKKLTSNAVKMLNGAGLNSKLGLLLLLKRDDIVAYRSFSNIAGLNVVFYDQLGSKELLLARKIVFLKYDLDVLREACLRWI